MLRNLFNRIKSFFSPKVEEKKPWSIEDILPEPWTGQHGEQFFYELMATYRNTADILFKVYSPLKNQDAFRSDPLFKGEIDVLYYERIEVPEFEMLMSEENRNHFISKRLDRALENYQQICVESRTPEEYREFVCGASVPESPRIPADIAIGRV